MTPFELKDYFNPRLNPNRYQGMRKGNGYGLAPQERWCRRQLVKALGGRQARHFIKNARDVHYGRKCRYG